MNPVAFPYFRVGAHRHTRRTPTPSSSRAHPGPCRLHPDDGGCSASRRSVIGRRAATTRIHNFPGLTRTCVETWDVDADAGVDAFADAMWAPSPEVIVTTIPWEEFSLHHPPGRVEVLAGLRDTCSSNGRGGGRGKAKARVEPL